MNILNKISIYNFQISECMESTATQNGFVENDLPNEKALLEKACLLILAGGQGTRLGTEKPKGLFEIDSIDRNPENKITLFKRHFDKIKAINKKHGITIKVIILCSDSTLSKTEEYIKSIYDKEVEYIKQENAECVDLNDEKLYKNKDEVQTSPNGNGGVFDALEEYKMFNKFETWRIEVLNVIGVDNAMANFLDVKVLSKFYSSPETNPSENPEINPSKDITRDIPNPSKDIPKDIKDEDIQSQKQLKYDIINKGVKRKIDEQAGIFEISGNKLIVKEYSEFLEGYKETIQPDTLINICHHYFSVEFLRKNKSNFSALKFHVAKKKIPYFDVKKNEFVTPQEINGKKFEKFIFDIFEFTDATRNITIEVFRDEFLPLKNLNGNDSVKTVRDGLMKEFIV